MSADASSSFVSLRRRSLFVAMFALAACESDPTPIVHENTNGDGSLSLAPTNSSGGRGGPGIGGKDPDYRLGANDRVRIIVFGQPTLTGEYTLDGNGVLAFPLIGMSTQTAKPRNSCKMQSSPSSILTI